MKRNAGFTLVEIMVVIVIIASLAAVLVANVWNSKEKASVKISKASIRMCKDHIARFYLDTGAYPERLEDLSKKPSSTKDWGGPYTDSIPKDGWEKPLQYRIPGPGDSPFDIGSLGRDGKTGGTSYDEDLWLSNIRNE